MVDLDTCIEVVRQFLFDELENIYVCQLGSSHRDESYVDFTKAIRIEHKSTPLHVVIGRRISIALDSEIIVRIWAQTLHTPNRSVTHAARIVDLAAPGFGKLLEYVDRDIQLVMERIDRISERYGDHVND